jgi:hypothetical protein
LLQPAVPSTAITIAASAAHVQDLPMTIGNPPRSRGFRPPPHTPVHGSRHHTSSGVAARGGIEVNAPSTRRSICRSAAHMRVSGAPTRSYQR